MIFLEAILSGFRNYVDFSDRAGRSQYWYWQLFLVIVVIPFGIIDQTLNPGTQMGVFSYINMIVVFALIFQASQSACADCTISTGQAGGCCFR
jgi:uncharacterized membrane protein YhaH (DUF805 family)